MFDVVISGAGPSGCKCAETLANAGFKVALIEKNKDWRKPCGGAVSSRIFKYFPQLRKLNFHEINGASMYSSDGNRIDYSWKDIRETSINVDRQEFDNIIREIAVDSGAELYDKNIAFDFINKDGKRYGIKTKVSGEIKEYLAPITIVADGMSSKLAIRLNPKNKWRIKETYQAKCAIMEGDITIDKTKISMFFQSYKGYGWIFPLKDNQFNVGCGTCNEDNLKYNQNEIFHNFLKNPITKKILTARNYKTRWLGSYSMPGQGVRESVLYDDNTMVIGDAAGFVSPISGEGIHPSVVSGEIAAKTAINALQDENFGKSCLKAYKFHPNIKKIIRNFKLKRSMVDFFFEKDGKQLNNMFQLAFEDKQYKEQAIDMFLFNKPLSKEFLLKLKSN
jgi:digeranylgeranylglycerophospholipid reductase